MRKKALKTQLKLMPLLLLCGLSGFAQAGGLAPLRVSADLLKGRVADGGAVNPAPQSEQGAAGPDDVATTSEPAGAEPDEPPEGDGSEGLAAGDSVEGVSPRPEAPRRTPPGPLAPAGPAGASDETEVFAERITGLRMVEMMAVGDAELRRGDLTLFADRMRYNELTDEVFAEGNVRLERGEDWVTGNWARFIVYQHRGEVDAPVYSFTRTVRRPDPVEVDEALPEEVAVSDAAVVGRGDAETLYFEGENQYRAVNATWTTCKPESPDWYIKASDLELDYDREVGTARGTSLVFKDVPLLWWPRFSFPLAQQRQSGFLTPTMGMSNRTGVDVSVPYYWNIAPNYDATLVPRYMGRRGLMLGGEYRYLSHDYEGETRVEWLPNDRVRGRSRALGSLQHEQRITPRLRGRLDLNAVSDDDYFEDLSSTLAVASQRNLLRDGRLNYSGRWWSAAARLQSYQTLEGSTPYRRLPQLRLDALRADGPVGSLLEFESEYVNFRNPEVNRVNGQRVHMYPQVSLPHIRPGYYITPKAGLHYTHYQLNDPVLDGRPDPAGTDSISRTLPILTLDSGLFFDRDASFFGNEFQQTLEPRFYYVRIPHENQDDIPRFDTGRFAFGFAQIFSENRFSGVDRVGDADHLTVAVTSRLIESDTGVERLRGTIGQRFHFADRRVRLTPREDDETRGRTDVLGVLSGRVTDAISVDSAFQYNVQDAETERLNLGVRYHPGHARVLNVGYRFAREDNEDVREGLRDVDVSAQWPLGQRWYGVGRLTRSLKEDRITEAIAGFEYVSECSCWAFRAAAHRFVLTEERATNAIFFQLELSGLGGLGPSPVNLLKRSVPGYGRITDSISGRYFGE